VQAVHTTLTSRIAYMDQSVDRMKILLARKNVAIIVQLNKDAAKN
jgi:hypothetical protein